MEQFTQVQERIVANKKRQGFWSDNFEREFNLTYGELSEAYEAWSKMEGDLGGEIADATIYLFSLAAMAGLDLGEEVARKMEINEQRSYKKLQNGTLVKE